MYKVEVIQNFDGTHLTTMKTPFKVKYYAEPETIDHLKELRAFIKKKSIPVFFLGRGSNTVFVEENYPGLIISTLKMYHELFEESETWVKVGSGYLLSRGVNWSMTKKYYTFIPWIGIPGTLGGAIYMNAGTSLGDSSEIVNDVTYFNFERGIVDQESNLDWSYRKNHFLNDFDFVVLAKLNKKTCGDEELNKAKEFLVKRKATQPIQTANCGSVFKNPVDMKAGKLIEDAGLKGLQIGGAQISELHGNFIINKNKAKGKDIYNLIVATQQEVHQKFNVLLEPEVRLIYPHDFLPIPILD